MRFAGSAAGLLQTIDFAGNVPKYDQIANTAHDGRTMERNAGTFGEARVAGAGLDAMGQIAAAEVGAAATRANGQASMMSSIGSGLASAAGGIGSSIIKKNTPG